LDPLFYAPADKDRIYRGLQAETIDALKLVADKLLKKAFPSDESRELGFIEKTFRNLTAIHELAHIMNYKVKGSFRASNREEMATRLREAESGHNPYLVSALKV
jgi:hypothetical protein